MIVAAYNYYNVMHETHYYDYDHAGNRIGIVYKDKQQSFNLKSNISDATYHHSVIRHVQKQKPK